MSVLDKAKEWLEDYFDHSTRIKVQDLIDRDDLELEDAFYKNLEFGTGGMRGIMGVGTNRINKYTLGQATQGLANYLHKKFYGKEIKVAVAYDVRNHSKEFAKIVADVLTANNIHVLLFKDHRPTPELSFVVRDKGCNAGIVLTASHNPPEYNGYKVYWNDGAQIVPPDDVAIIEEVKKVKFSEIDFKGNDHLTEKLGEEADQGYIDACIKNSLYQDLGRDRLNVVFTAIHGTTYATIPKALEKAGFSRVDSVREQGIPSGNFPTVDSPNPEEPEALSMAMDLAETTNADIVIGTDPDGDRVGIAVRNLEDEMELLNGNQTNVALSYYILDQWRRKGKITGNEFIGSTIVSSDVFLDLARKFGVDCKVGLTGFKWIGKMIREEAGKRKFICGGEESYGFLTGDFVRDKDSCGTALLACEMAAYYKYRGSSFYRFLLGVYKELGFYRESLVNLVRKGREGTEEIKGMMNNFRKTPPEKLAGSQVICIQDFEKQIRVDLKENTFEEMKETPKSNVLIFYTEDRTKVAVRPSGTEPKIKFYISVKGNLDNILDYKKSVFVLNEKINRIKRDLGI
ncbi:MAG: phospho-sugar mutase [Bergeyella sp.]|nr:phospho-sugar mutase [Bergeyella sp.]